PAGARGGLREAPTSAGSGSGGDEPRHGGGRRVYDGGGHRARGAGRGCGTRGPGWNRWSRGAGRDDRTRGAGGRLSRPFAASPAAHGATASVVDAPQLVLKRRGVTLHGLERIGRRLADALRPG